MKISVFICFIVLCSCKTYRHSEELSSWVDPYNVKYKVVKTEIYDRKTKTLIKTRIDTITFNDRSIDDIMKNGL